jgi:predicted branched-subunit amino acid permease
MSEPGPPQSSIRDGVRAGLPFAFASFALSVSFGVVAQPLIGTLATVVMSVIVFAGAAQAASLSVLAAGGGVPAAVIAGLLVNSRFLPMGFAAGPAFHGRLLKRAVDGQAIVDASWAVSSRGDGTFDRQLLIGGTIPQYLAWQLGTLVGVFFGSALSDPNRFGLDAIFPAFYLALLFTELRRREAVGVAVAAVAVTLVLLPVAPPGVPVVAASLTALYGLRRGW